MGLDTTSPQLPLPVQPEYRLAPATLHHATCCQVQELPIFAYSSCHSVPQQHGCCTLPFGCLNSIATAFQQQEKPCIAGCPCLGVRFLSYSFHHQSELPASCQGLSLNLFMASDAHAFSACAAMGSLRLLLCSKQFVWMPCIPCNCLFSTIHLGKARNLGFSGLKNHRRQCMGVCTFIVFLSENRFSIPQKLPAFFKSSPYVSGDLCRIPTCLQQYKHCPMQPA